MPIDGEGPAKQSGASDFAHLKELGPKPQKKLSEHMNLNALNNEPRRPLGAKFKPIAGTRFQPTGFPDLGVFVPAGSGSNIP
ncbi:MAG: hypothetical protein L0Y58_25555 [Verrucomicrobia subdivision 3 bacterium]|nr:hypothetical protein [Limisphaerales bacterium]